MSILTEEIESFLSSAAGKKLIKEAVSSLEEQEIKFQLEIWPWDKAETKLIIDPLFDGYKFALVNHKNELVAKGKAGGNVSTLVSFLDVKKENVYIDMGAPFLPTILEICKREGYTPVKGTGSGAIKQIEVQGQAAFLIDHKKPPFCFLV